MRLHWILTFFVLSLIPLQTWADDAPSDSIPQVHQMELGQWRLGFHSGFAYLWASTSNDENQLISDGADEPTVDKFYKQLHKGYYFSFDVYRMFAHKWGIGIKYSLMVSYAREYIRLGSDANMNVLNVNIFNREYVNYVGPSFYMQQWFKNARAWCLYSSVSVGYARYRDEFETDFVSPYFGENTLATGNAFGGSLEVGFEYFPTKLLSVIGGVGCFLAKFDNLDVTTADGNNPGYYLGGGKPRNVSQLDVFLGIKFYLK